MINAIIQNETNLVMLVIESENPILTPPPDYVIDVTNYEYEILEGMIYNSETNEFETVENANTEN